MFESIRYSEKGSGFKISINFTVVNLNMGPQKIVDNCILY